MFTPISRSKDKKKNKHYDLSKSLVRPFFSGQKNWEKGALGAWEYRGIPEMTELGNGTP